MKFQGSKLEIEAPESKTYILHCKMYVFPILEWIFKVPNLEFKPQSQKHTFYTVKCMFFFNFGMKFQDSKFEIEAPESKTYMLHYKMYVLGSGLVLWKSMFGSCQLCENIHFTL